MDRTRSYFETLFSERCGPLGCRHVDFIWWRFPGVPQLERRQSRMDTKLQETQRPLLARGQQAILETDRAFATEQKLLSKRKHKAYVRQVAKEKTGAELTGVIRQTVGEQVAERVKAEEPQIKSTVVQETKRAVDEQKPYISAEVQKQSSETLAPLRTQVESYKRF